MQVLNGKEREVVEMLHGYGLCDNEAKAYFTLLAVGESKAWNVARKASIPPSKVHETLERLIERGFVELVEIGRPRTYRPRALEEALELAVEAKNSEIRKMRQDTNKLVRVLEAVAPMHQVHSEYRLFTPSYRRYSTKGGDLDGYD